MSEYERVCVRVQTSVCLLVIRHFVCAWIWFMAVNFLSEWWECQFHQFKHTKIQIFVCYCTVSFISSKRIKFNTHRTFPERPQTFGVISIYATKFIKCRFFFLLSKNTEPLLLVPILCLAFSVPLLSPLSNQMFTAILSLARGK